MHGAQCTHVYAVELASFWSFDLFFRFHLCAFCRVRVCLGVPVTDDPQYDAFSIALQTNWPTLYRCTCFQAHRNFIGCCVISR